MLVLYPVTLLNVNSLIVMWVQNSSLGLEWIFRRFIGGKSGGTQTFDAVPEIT